MNTLKALQILGLPETFAKFEGRITTLTTRSFRMIENYDTSSGTLKIYYTIEKSPEVTSLFGLYPFNYLANSIYHMGFNIESETDSFAVLRRPSTWVVHPAESGLAGQRVYYVEAKINASESAIDYMWEPYETVVNGKAEDMKDPIIQIGYYARTIVKGTDGKPRISWTSRYSIKPKRVLRRAEFLKIAGMTMDEYIYQTRRTYNVQKCDNTKFITSIGMDIEQNRSELKSVVYINGTDANTFDYKKLINSFDKTYDGYLWQWRLMNGPRIGTSTTDNVYGSTLNIGIGINGENETIEVVSGSTNEYNGATQTLTYNPSLQEQATVITYMEFLPAGGKNENCGKQLNLETGVESLF